MVRSERRMVSCFASVARRLTITSPKMIGKAWGEGLTEKAVWHVVREYASKAGNEKLAPHDLRRTCARLCHAAGGELEQIQFLLGHVSIQMTERYYAQRMVM
jgi:site-specific recombinase XerD